MHWSNAAQIRQLTIQVAVTDLFYRTKYTGKYDTRVRAVKYIGSDLKWTRDNFV